MMAILVPMCLPEKMGWTLLLVVLVYLDCIGCTENTTQSEGGANTTHRTDVAAQGNEETMTQGNANQERRTTVADSTLGRPTSEAGETDLNTPPTPITEQYETTTPPTFGTIEDTDAPGGSLTPKINSSQSAFTTMMETTKPKNSTKGFEIHWFLFTGWHMPVALACLEIVAYLFTIFIVFGFSKNRSKIKRFGHFSWKRPNPFPDLDEIVSTPTGRAIVAGVSQMGHNKLQAKKPSVRGHTP